MLFQFSKIEKIVSIFIVSTLLIIVTLFVMMGKFNDWFSDKFIYFTEYTSARGLKVGSPVLFRDNEWEIGTVSAIELNNLNNKIKVYIQVLKKYSNNVRGDSIAFLSKTGFAGIAGQTSIKITIGSQQFDPLPNRRKIPSSDSHEGQIMMQDMSIQVSHDIEAKINNIAANINDLTRPSGPLEQSLQNVKDITKYVKDGVEFQRINKLINDISSKVNFSLDDINKITGNINKVIDSTSPKIDKSILRLTENIEVILNQFTETTKNLIKLLERQANPIMQDLHQAIKKILNDLTVAINSTVGSVQNNVTASLNDFRLILQNVRIMTTRLNTLLDQVEKQIPFIDKNKKPKPNLIDEIDRGG